MNGIEYSTPHVPMDIFALAKLYKGAKSQASAMNQSLKEEFSEGEILEDGDDIFEVFEELDAIESAAIGVLGAGVSFALYKAIKEFLYLEGARRRGEIKNSEVIKRVRKIAWKAGKKGVAVGAILAVVITIFGSSILIPLSIISPFIGIQMAVSLLQSFWKGLDDAQKQELLKMTGQLGGKIKNLFAALDKPVKNVSGGTALSSSVSSPKGDSLFFYPYESSNPSREAHYEPQYSHTERTSGARLNQAIESH